MTKQFRPSRRALLALVAGVVTMAGTTVSAQAQGLLDKAKAGDPIRIGFANEVPWAYPSDDGKPVGFVNAIAIGILNKMGITNIEPVQTEWGGLIPGLQANRSDVITGGMYILKERCDNVLFSDPIGVFGDAFIVKTGNPKGIENYKDIADKGAMFVTGAGYNTIKVAKEQGVPESNIMEVPGPTEILAAVRSGRADAGGVTYFTARNLADQSDGTVEVTDPSMMPKETLNWVGIAVRKADTAFMDAFNKALHDYIGSDEMMAAVKQYGYTKAQLPGDATTQYACENR